MPQCDNCGEHISERFKRVFGDRAGNIYACLHCSANAGIGAVTRDRGERR